MGSRRGITSLFRGSNDYEYTRLGAQVQNVPNKTVYVFGDGDVAEDDVVEFEMETVRSRKKIRSQRETDKPLFVERPIAEGDSLHSLCLQYGCPVSEMKRVNNLINDQDFHALTRIKIPVKHNSFLIEQIERDSKDISADRTSTSAQLNGAAAYIGSDDEYEINNESDMDRSTTDLSDPETQKHVIRKISINSAARGNNSEARKFLENMDKDLSKIMNSKRTDRHSLDEVISVLTNKSVHPLVPKRQETWTDFSIRYRSAIVIFVIVAILFPLAVLVWYLYRSSHNGS